MKKGLIIFLLLKSLQGYSQNIEKFGLVTGITYTTLEWEYKTAGDGFKLDFNNIIGLNEGLFFELQGSKYFNIIVNTMYIEKGGESNIEIKDDGVVLNKIQEKLKYNYWSFSVGGKIKCPIGNFNLFATLCPRFDDMVSTKDNYLFYGDIGKSINRFNWGLIYGLGLDYSLKKISIIFNIENNLNFGRINNTYYRPGEFGLEINDKTFVFNIGIAKKIN